MSSNLNQIEGLCCNGITINCDVTGATNFLFDLNGDILQKNWSSKLTCPEATNRVQSLNHRTIGYNYPTAMNGATIEAVSLLGISLGFGF